MQFQRVYDDQYLGNKHQCTAEKMDMIQGRNKRKKVLQKVLPVVIP
jgi:hypothetical protein